MRISQDIFLGRTPRCTLAPSHSPLISSIPESHFLSCRAAMDFRRDSLEARRSRADLWRSSASTTGSARSSALQQALLHPSLLRWILRSLQQRQRSHTWRAARLPHLASGKVMQPFYDHLKINIHYYIFVFLLYAHCNIVLIFLVFYPYFLYNIVFSKMIHSQEKQF